MRTLLPGDEDWPSQLNELDEPPAQLYLYGTGDAGLLSRPAIAIVGARAATSYGEFVATDLACALSAHGYVVISGGAYGIDVAAHRGAMAGPTPTVLVTAGGVDRPYPAGHVNLFDRVAGQGLVVSEYAPGTAPSRDHFLARNRIIAALAQGLVVVEASLRSSSMYAVGQAGHLNRPVMAIPGPITSAVSARPNQLIRDGRATLVTNSTDVIGVLHAAELIKEGA